MATLVTLEGAQDHRTSPEEKKLGYSRSKRIRIYGEEFEIVSDPFVEGNGLAVEVITRTDTQVRTLRLPLVLLQGLKEEILAEVA
jgi:hypothetical protein